MSDATIPILADGFKWLGYTPKHGFLWNFGYYNDWLSHNQSFSTYHNQTVLHAVWLPIHSDEKSTVLHLGVNLTDLGRQVQKIHTDGQLVPVGLPAPRGRLWHWPSGSIQPQRQYSVLSDSASTRVLEAVRMSDCSVAAVPHILPSDQSDSSRSVALGISLVVSFTRSH